MSDEKILLCRLKKPNAKIRLICFSCAGTGGNQFATWGKRLSSDIEVVAVTLPGRESRHKEALCFCARTIADSIAEAISSRFSDKPFCFFGHSMGALLCQEVAGVLNSCHGGPEPLKIYLSGESPPQTERKVERKDYQSLNDQDCKKALKDLGCVDQDVLQNEELMKVYLPIFRADLTVVNQIVYDLPSCLLKKPLACPIMFFNALEDNEYDNNGWSKLTTGQLTVTDIPGSHSYLKDPISQQRLIDIFNKDLVELADGQ